MFSTSCQPIRPIPTSTCVKLVVALVREEKATKDLGALVVLDGPPLQLIGEDIMTGAAFPRHTRESSARS